MKQDFNVQGMSCEHCVRMVTQAVQALDPAAQVQVDLAGGRVAVESGQPRDRLVEAIEDEGYTVTG